MKLGSEEIQFMRAFESISKVIPRDCIITPTSLVFLVNGKDMGQAIGKNGQTIKRMKEKLGKNIEVLELASDAEMFVKKALFNLKFEEITLKDGVMLLNLNSENRKKLLNSTGKLKKVKEAAKRNYQIKEIKIR